MLALQGPIILEHRKTKKTLSQTEETEGNQTGSDRQTSELHETDRQTPEAPELSFFVCWEQEAFLFGRHETTSVHSFVGRHWESEKKHQCWILGV